MIVCPKCGKVLADNAKFCDACGERVAIPAPAPAPVPVVEAPVAAEPVAEAPAPAVVFCETCGTKNDAGFAFCENCGNPLKKPEEPAAPAAKTGFDIKAVPQMLEKKGIPAKWVKLGAAALAVVLTVVILLSLFTGGGTPNYALYLKDGEMFYSDLPSFDGVQLTDDLTDGQDIGNSSLANAANALGYFAVMSEDGKTLFYADRIGNGGVTLYVRSVSNTKKEPIKIGEDIKQYRVSENGKLVVFLTDDGDLYQSNLKMKDKIDSDVSTFYVSEDCKTIVYTVREDDETTVYYRKGGNEPAKFAGDITSLYQVSEDCKTIYFYKDDHFYKQVFGKDKEKLVSDVSSVVKMYSEKSMYYTKTDDRTSVLFDFVEDDMASVDANMEEPIRPTYPNYSDYGLDRYEEYQAAVNKYNEAINVYWDAYYLYQDKLQRDRMREQLKDSETTYQTYALYYFDGKKETKLADNVGQSGRTTATDEAVILFQNRESSEIEKIKLSEVSGAWEVENRVQTAMQSGRANYCIAIKDTVVELSFDDASNFHLTADGKVLYFVDERSEDGTEGNLNKAEITGSKVKDAKTIEEDIYPSYITYLDDGKYLVFRDVEDDEGALYLTDKKLSDDVYTNYIRYTNDGKFVCFMTDWDVEDREGTLNVSKNGKTKVVSDDVHSFVLTPDNQVLYLYDYNTDKYRGELYLYKGSKAKKVEDDVIAIVPVYTAKRVGYIF